MVLGKLSWVGIAAAVLGWLAIFFGDWAMGKARLWADPVYVVGVGQGLILTGIGLAIVDALQQGFGALNRFFEAVLQRSAARVQSASADASAPHTPSRRPAPAPRPTPAPQPTAEPEPEIVERGRITDRAYLLYADGSVEVETLLGVRRFSSMDEAREFIGS